MNAVATPPRKARPGASKKERSVPQRTGAAPAKAAPAARPAEAVSALPQQAIGTAFSDVQKLLDLACQTDEAHDWSGDSERLLRLASRVAGEARIDPPEGDEIQCVAFDIAALIRAARLVPGDEESPARKKLIDQAAVTLNWLTGSNPSRDNCCDPGVPRPAAPNAANTVEAVAPNAWEHVIGDVMCRHETAQALLEKFAEENRDQPGVMGVLALVQTLEASLAKIGESSPGLNDHLKGVFPDISADYLIAADVARAVNAKCEESIMWAAIYLLDDCKAIVDAHVDALTAAHASAAGKAVSP